VTVRCFSYKIPVMTGGASASPVVSCGEVVMWLEYPKLFSEEMLDALESDAKAVLEQFAQMDPAPEKVLEIARQEIYGSDMYSRAMRLVQPKGDVLVYQVLDAQYTLIRLLGQVFGSIDDIRGRATVNDRRLSMPGPTLQSAAIALSMLPAYYLECADVEEDRETAKRLMLYVAPYQVLALQCLLKGGSDGHRLLRLTPPETDEDTRVVDSGDALAGYSGMINYVALAMFENAAVVKDLRAMARFFDAHPDLQMAAPDRVYSSGKNEHQAVDRALQVVERAAQQEDEPSGAWSDLLERTSTVLGDVYDEVRTLDVSAVSDAWFDAFRELQVAALHYFRMRELMLEMWPGMSMLRMWAEEARIGGTGCGGGCSPMTFAQLKVELKQRERAAEKILDLWGLVTCDRVADLVAALPSAWVVSPT